MIVGKEKMFASIIKLFHNDTAAVKPPPTLPHKNNTVVMEDENNKDGISWLEIDRTFSEMLLGVKSLVTGPMDKREKLALKAIKKQFLKNEMPENLVPRLPAIVPKLMLAIRSKNSNVSDLAELLASDAVLVKEVLRLANSVFYRRSQVYYSLEQAIVNIGFKGIRQLIISAAMKPLLNTYTGHFFNSANDHLWHQNLYAGLLSDCVTKKTCEDQFHAYLANLTLHSCMTILSRELDNHFDSDDAPGSIKFVDKLNRYALAISVRISEQWQFPDAVSSILREQVTFNGPLEMSKLAAIIHLSDKLSKLHLLLKNDYMKEFSHDVSHLMPDGLDDVFNDCLKVIDLNEE